jgi:hypothetical protein
MFYINKPEPQAKVVLRMATADELYCYEKAKAANFEDDSVYEQGSASCDCSFKNKCDIEKLFADEFFFINCELSENDDK